MDEVPVGKASTDFDDIPIGGNKGGGGFGGNEMEEVPLGGGGRGGYNLDALGDEAFGGPPPGSKGNGEIVESKPKRAPPARLAQKKPVEEEKKEEDSPMKDEAETVAEVKKPAPRAPPKLSAAKEESKTPASKPAAKTASTAGGPKGPSIQEEDVGAGLSKEEAEAKVVETFPEDVVACFEDSKKWNEKVEGYKGISSNIVSL